MDVNYMKKSLDHVDGLSFHWSSDCNMACQYCFIKKDKDLMSCYNSTIQQALEDGTFIKNVKNIMKDTAKNIKVLELWGAEPTLNAKYFPAFIKEILDFFPNAKNVMFSTNALVGGKIIYDYFFIPLHEYAESHQRNLNFELQFSLDGPPEYNDKSRHEHATENSVAAMHYLIDHFPKNTEYLTLEMNTKTTVDTEYMEDMLQGGLERYYWYYGFFDNLQWEINQKIKNQPRIVVRCLAHPTLVDPGTHTVKDGKILASWIDKLCEIDKSRFKCRHTLLFDQLLNGLHPFFHDKNIIAHGPEGYSCSGTKNEITIGYDGRLYGCNRLGKNAVYSDEVQRKNSINYSASSFNLKGGAKEWLKRTYGQYAFHEDILARKHFCDALIPLMVQAGQIDKKYLTDADEQLMLFIFTTCISCHIGIDEDLTHNVFCVPTSYLKLFGNGAIDSFLRYLRIEKARGYWSL